MLKKCFRKDLVDTFRWLFSLLKLYPKIFDITTRSSPLPNGGEGEGEGAKC
jgi:hypothetical protein